MIKRSNSALAAFLTLAGAVHARPVEFSITDLGSLPASEVCNCFFATSISQNGNVTGFYFGPQGERRGFIWQDGVISDVGGAPGEIHFPLGVNDAGVVAGFGDALGFRAQNGVITDLPSLGGRFADARDINNAGLIVGQATLPDQLSRAVRWVNDEPIELGTFGGPLSLALGVNDVGQIVGWAWDEKNDQRAFVWTEADGMVELAAPKGSTLVQASDINNLGHAVGSAALPVSGDPNSLVFRGFIWIDGVPTDIGDMGDPDLNSVAIGGVNDAGVIVGAVNFGFKKGRPFIRRDAVLVDPNTLIDPDKGWTIESVVDINNAGQIAASGFHIDGRRHALLLSPVVVDCVADFNADGFVNSQDFFAFLEAFFAQSKSADIDASGTINSADFFTFLTAFFEGC